MRGAHFESHLSSTLHCGPWSGVCGGAEGAGAAVCGVATGGAVLTESVADGVSVAAAGRGGGDVAGGLGG